MNYDFSIFRATRGCYAVSSYIVDIDTAFYRIAFKPSPVSTLARVEENNFLPMIDMFGLRDSEVLRSFP